MCYTIFKDCPLHTFPTSGTGAFFPTLTILPSLLLELVVFPNTYHSPSSINHSCRLNIAYLRFAILLYLCSVLPSYKKKRASSSLAMAQDQIPHWFCSMNHPHDLIDKICWYGLSDDIERLWSGIHDTKSVMQIKKCGLKGIMEGVG